MGKDTPPSLEEIGEGDELPEYWTEETTITVRRYTKERLNEHRDGRPWDTYLEQLRREHADPLNFNDVEQIIDELQAQLEQPTVDSQTLAEDISQQLDLDVDLSDEILVGDEITDSQLDTIAKRMDDLETQLKTIRDELRGR